LENPISVRFDLGVSIVWTHRFFLTVFVRHKKLR
jgi:hypothetical protein